MSCWLSDALSEEQSHFLGLVPMRSARDENLTGVPEVLMEKARGGRVKAQIVGLLVSTGEATDRETRELLSSGVVLPAKTPTPVAWQWPTLHPQSVW